MPKQSNIYDLVEGEAARRGVPRLKLWEEALRALIEEKLRPLNLNLSERPDAVASPTTYRGWLNDILGYTADRRFDPGRIAHTFRKIMVRHSDFESWLRKTKQGRRGPKPNSTGYQCRDRKLFPQIERLINSGRAQSPHGAALRIVSKIAGSGTAESKAKRVSALYRKEC